MDLIDEKERALALRAAGAGHVENFAQFGDARKDRRDLFEVEVEALAEQPRDRGLASARWAPEDHRGQALGLQHAADRAVGAQEMILTDDFGQRFRAQPVSEW